MHYNLETHISYMAMYDSQQSYMNIMAFYGNKESCIIGESDNFLAKIIKKFTMLHNC